MRPLQNWESYNLVYPGVPGFEVRSFKMGRKSGNFFEEHVDKIVLAVVGLLCLWLLITRVLISPNYIEYDNKKFDPGRIDNYIGKQAEVLKDKLNRKPEPKSPYEPSVDKLVAKIDSAISNIDISLSPPQPIYSLTSGSDNRVYSIPRIGKVNEPVIEHIRAVAYVPLEEIDGQDIYDQAEHEPNDIDFVTIEAKFDVAGLYDRFYESFAGANVQDEWRDPCLAVPIFAAVQLQRRELLSNNSWSDWQIVPRTKIDRNKKRFEIIEDVDDLPAGGIKVRLYQFKGSGVTKDLLQPEAYAIASAKEEWFPPTLHKEYAEQQREIDAQERREAKAAEKQQREKERGEDRVVRRTRTATTRPGASSPFSGAPFGGGQIGGSPFGGGPFSGGMSGMPTRMTQPRRSRTERRVEKGRPDKVKEIAKTKKSIYEKLDDILITEKTDISEMDEPLVFWAHDDTVEPERSYQYRIRLGTFNPIAGTNQFSKRDKSLNSKVILWSEFSDVTETVDIPRRLYFFPREIQEAAKTVTVTASRYVLGYWYCQDFTVKQGEVIGKAVEYKPTDEEEKDKVTVPKMVDYATGAILLDVVPVNDWSGGRNLRTRHYFDMLYSFDGTNIERIPIRTSYWAEDLRLKFNEIKRLEKEPKEPLRERGVRGRERYLPQPPGMPPGMIPGMPPGMWGPEFGPPYR